MIAWKRDKSWSDRFLPEMKSILGVYLIGEPPVEEDAERNTDLMVLRMEAVRIACRIRTSGYAAQYGDEFTIRSGRPKGVQTELSKVVAGWGDYFFYGFASEDSECLDRWFIGDLRVFRLWFNRELFIGNKPGLEKKNRDGSSSFHVFRVGDLPKEFVIGCSDLHEGNHTSRTGLLERSA